MQTSCLKLWKEKRSYAFSGPIEGRCQIPILSLIVLILAMLPEAFASEYTSHPQSGISSFKTGEYISRMMMEQTTGEGRETGTQLLLCQEGGGSGLPKDLRKYMAFRRLDALYEFYYYARKNYILPEETLNILKDELEKTHNGTWISPTGIRCYYWSGDLPVLQARINRCGRVGGRAWANYYAQWQQRRIKLVNQRLTILNTYLQTFLKVKYNDNPLNDYHLWAPESIGVVSHRNVDFLEMKVTGEEDKSKERYPSFLEEYRRGVYGRD